MIDVRLESGSPNTRGIRVFTKCKLCDNDTKENKPYCIDHISNLPYVQKVRNNLDKIHLEEIGRIKPQADSIIMKDIRESLNTYGSTTVQRLAIRLHISVHAIRRYAKAKLIEIHFKKNRGEQSEIVSCK